MPVPRPLAFREAPSGVGATRTAGWALELGVGGVREPQGVGGTSSRTFLWPVLRSEPGKGRGGLPAAEREGVGSSLLSHPSPTEVAGP